MKASRLVIEPVDGLVERDTAALLRAKHRRITPPGLVYEHLPARLEQGLWAADAIAWAYGAGGHWHRRIARTIERVVTV